MNNRLQVGYLVVIKLGILRRPVTERLLEFCKVTGCRAAGMAACIHRGMRILDVDKSHTLRRIVEDISDVGIPVVQRRPTGRLDETAGNSARMRIERSSGT